MSSTLISSPVCLAALRKFLLHQGQALTIASAPTALSQKAWDYTKYVYDTQAWVPKNVVFVNERIFQALPEPVRKIVNGAFTAANLPAFGPHAFRHMLARHATRTCTSVAELVATSQNLGHTDVLTTLRSYGQIDRDRMRALITGEKCGDRLEE